MDVLGYAPGRLWLPKREGTRLREESPGGIAQEHPHKPFNCLPPHPPHLLHEIAGHGGLHHLAGALELLEQAVDLGEIGT